MDDDLRASLWNALSAVFWDRYESPGESYVGRSDYVRGSNIESLAKAIWLHHFKRPTDTIPQWWRECYKLLREHFFSSTWFEAYDFIEFIAAHCPKATKADLCDISNHYLERENSAYRFVNGQITEITSAEEIESVEQAIAASTPFSGVKVHLETALSLMSRRENPDYRNSIKESISAVESLARQLSGDSNGTLGAILKSLEQTMKLHPALRSAFSSLYGFTSDSNGIRHALLEEPNLTKADARLMLVACSAFTNYVLESSQRNSSNSNLR